MKITFYPILLIKLFLLLFLKFYFIIFLNTFFGYFFLFLLKKIWKFYWFFKKWKTFLPCTKSSLVFPLLFCSVVSKTCRNPTNRYNRIVRIVKNMLFLVVFFVVVFFCFSLLWEPQSDERFFALVCMWLCERNEWERV